MMLNHRHSYYYQYQMQMSVTETSYCDFVVWSETGDFHCERILPDTDFTTSIDMEVILTTGGHSSTSISPPMYFINIKLNHSKLNSSSHDQKPIPVLAEKFFYLAILPELLGKWFTRDHTALPTVMLHDDSDEEEDNGSWCYCQEAKGGDMIGYENVSCSIKWFHKECLRIKQGKDPKGKWLCPSCYAVQNPPKKQLK